MKRINFFNHQLKPTTLFILSNLLAVAAGIITFSAIGLRLLFTMTEMKLRANDEPFAIVLIMIPAEIFAGLLLVFSCFATATAFICFRAVRHLKESVFRCNLLTLLVVSGNFLLIAFLCLYDQWVRPRCWEVWGLQGPFVWLLVIAMFSLVCGISVLLLPHVGGERLEESEEEKEGDKDLEAELGLGREVQLVATEIRSGKGKGAEIASSGF